MIVESHIEDISSSIMIYIRDGRDVHKKKRKSFSYDGYLLLWLHTFTTFTR